MGSGKSSLGFRGFRAVDQGYMDILATTCLSPVLLAYLSGKRWKGLGFRN